MDFPSIVFKGYWIVRYTQNCFAVYPAHSKATAFTSKSRQECKRWIERQTEEQAA